MFGGYKSLYIPRVYASVSLMEELQKTNVKLVTADSKQGHDYGKQTSPTKNTLHFCMRLNT